MATNGNVKAAEETKDGGKTAEQAEGEQEDSGYIVSAISAVGSAGYSVVTLPSSLASWGMNRAFLNKEKAKAALLEYTSSMRHNMMSNVKDMIVTGATSDPNMWRWLKRLIANMFDSIWADLEAEVEGDLEAALLGVIQDNEKHPNYNTIWARIPGPPDLYQLVMYIQSFKAYLFLTSGIITVITATMMYFNCYTYFRNTMADCVDATGPASLDGEIQIFDWGFSIILPWIAFLLMPFATHPEVKFVAKNEELLYEPPKVQEPSEKKEGEPVITKEKKDPDEIGCWEAATIGTQYESTAEVPAPPKRRRKKKKKKVTALNKLMNHIKRRGNNMIGFLKYDFCAFAGCMAFLAKLTYTTVHASDFKSLLASPQFITNLFWVRTVYNFLMFPYFLLSLPMVAKMVTHTRVTGYNEQGAVVFFEVPYVPPVPPPSLMTRAAESWSSAKQKAKQHRQGTDSKVDDSEALTYGETLSAAWIAVGDDLNDEKKEKPSLTQVDENKTLLQVWDRF